MELNFIPKNTSKIQWEEVNKYRINLEKDTLIRNVDGIIKEYNPNLNSFGDEEFILFFEEIIKKEAIARIAMAYSQNENLWCIDVEGNSFSYFTIFGGEKQIKTQYGKLKKWFHEKVLL